MCCCCCCCSRIRKEKEVYEHIYVCFHACEFDYIGSTLFKSPFVTWLWFATYACGMWAHFELLDSFRANYHIHCQQNTNWTSLLNRVYIDVKPLHSRPTGIKSPRKSKLCISVGVVVVGQGFVRKMKYMNTYMCVSMHVNLSLLALLYSRVPLLRGYGLLLMLAVRGLTLRC